MHSRPEIFLRNPFISQDTLAAIDLIQRSLWLREAIHFNKKCRAPSIAMPKTLISSDTFNPHDGPIRCHFNDPLNKPFTYHTSPKAHPKTLILPLNLFWHQCLFPSLNRRVPYIKHPNSIQSSGSIPLFFRLNCPARDSRLDISIIQKWELFMCRRVEARQGVRYHTSAHYRAISRTFSFVDRFSLHFYRSSR